MNKKENICIECGNETKGFGEKCMNCAHKGKNNGRFKNGKPKCIDCGEEISYSDKRCKKCFMNYLHNNHFNFKGGFPNCIDCGKKLSRYDVERCKQHSQLELWKEQKYRNKRIKASLRGLKLKPNKPEKFLNKLLGKDYKFVGDGQVILGGFNPDFINVNHQKKIIELFGDYWHNRRDWKKRDKRRLISYKKLGYSTLIVWEHELKDLDKIKSKILEFNKIGVK